nr:MAG TPA: hypothetical protein [Caudoviricetes sp.]
MLLLLLSLKLFRFYFSKIVKKHDLPNRFCQIVNCEYFVVVLHFVDPP